MSKSPQKLPTIPPVIVAMAADPDFGALPAKERERLRGVVAAFEKVKKPGVTEQLHTLADQWGKGYSTVRRHFSDWQENKDWRNLVNGHKLRQSPNDRTGNKEFQEHFRQLCENHNRSTAAAIRELKLQWKSGDHIPGYEGVSRTGKYPPGWTQRNLYRYAPEAKTLSLMRQGEKKSRKYMPQVLRTRVGLWPASHIQFDDVWHDHYVRYGDNVTRVLEFGALDVWSADRFAWGTKPRMPKNESNRAGIDGGHEGLKAREFRLFFASVLWNQGYSPNGTTMMLEHNTASLSDKIIDLLSDSTGGLITVDPGGLSGEQQAILGLWGGRNGGHGNWKSNLESLHNLIHNDLGSLPGQTGKDRQSAPEATYGIVRYQEALLKWARDLPPELAQELKHPLLDYHTQFLPLLSHMYRVAISGRTEHDLEGWKKLGREITEYTLDPDSGVWLDIDALSEASRGLILANAKSDLKRWTNRRLLSPGEVWGQGRRDLLRANATMIADIIGEDEGKERKVKGSYFRFHDSDIDTDELFYESRIRRLDGREEELRDGEKFLTLVNPYAPESLIVLDARGRCLGTAGRVHRVSHADHDGKIAMWARNAERTSDQLAPLRERWEGKEREAQDLREHNAELGFRGTKKRDGSSRRDSGTREAEALEKKARPRTKPELKEAPPVSAIEDLTSDDDCPYV